MLHSIVRRLVFSLLLAAAVAGHAADVRVYVQFAAGQKSAAESAIAQAGGRMHHEFDNLNAIALTLPEAARAALARNPVFTLVEIDPTRGFLAQTTPYGVAMVQAPEAIAAGATGAGIKVGVIDSGVFSGHEDFAGVALTGEPDFGANDQRTWYRDHLSHGTHVVGTIAAANNSLGVVGVSPGTIAIHMVKVFGDGGNWVYSSDLLAAARAAHAKGAKIISMSLGGAGGSGTEEAGFADLYNRGALLIAAAGNDGTTALNYPASYGTVVSVAAIDSAKNVASFSQKNAAVELAAPGVGVLSTTSFTESNFVAASGATYAATHIEFAARGNVSAALAYGGLGTGTNTAWRGKVVLVDRGTNSFYEKVRNVQASGGLACIVANNAPGGFEGTLGTGNSSTIPAVGVSQEDGAVLKNLVGLSITVTTLVNNNVSSYEAFDGTSMATPHVSGVAALIWSKYPGATNAQVRQALVESAEDLGVAGRDASYGHGLIRANAALSALAAMNPAAGDTTAPVISALTARVTHAKNGSFEITWTTNELATSDVQLNNTLYADATMTVTHRRTFRGTKGATYTYVVMSKDAAGNVAVSETKTITIR